MIFVDWLKTQTKRSGDLLSNATVEHYAQGLKTISEEMFSRHVINKKLEDMDINELDLAVVLIFDDPFFKAKDAKGNKMYSNAVKRYRYFMNSNTESEAQEKKQISSIETDALLSATEKESLIKARRGQGKYRDLILSKYDYKCIMTGISIPKVLIASHIKPWAVCNNKERIDVNNGLLLSATYDRLFDCGLITFNKKGKLRISSMINNENAQKLKIAAGTLYNIKYCSKMDKYLQYHNKYIFIN